MAASSTTGDNHSLAPRSSDPTLWSIEEVVQHISETDAGLGTHMELFRKHVSCETSFPQAKLIICDANKPTHQRSVIFALK